MSKVFRVAIVCLVIGASTLAQSPRTIPRPPAQSGPPTPADGSAAPDGYAPLPAWPGQTRAPRPTETTPYRVETVAEGFTGAFCFAFLPDGRAIVG